MGRAAGHRLQPPGPHPHSLRRGVPGGGDPMTDARLRPGARTWTATAQGCEFRLDIFVDPDSETAAAILYYQADGLAAAIARARRFLGRPPRPGRPVRRAPPAPRRPRRLPGRHPPRRMTTPPRTTRTRDGARDHSVRAPHQCPHVPHPALTEVWAGTGSPAERCKNGRFSAGGPFSRSAARIAPSGPEVGVSSTARATAWPWWPAPTRGAGAAGRC